MKKIYSIAKQMVTEGKGILAADESTSTANKRLEAIGMDGTEQNRKLFRELFLDTEGIEKYLKGVILYDETIRQEDSKGRKFTDILKEKEILIGIKVDEGKDADPDSKMETVTKGLDGLDDRLIEYKKMGAVFAKWRAVIKIEEDLPTVQNIEKEAVNLAEYAKICQDNEIVPMVEPEVLLNGNHTLERAKEVLELTMNIVFDELKNAGVDLQGVILKTSMVVAGSELEHAKSKDVAKATVSALINTVPKEAAGVVFLSGGQSADEATQNLLEISKIKGVPWPMTFSFSRALQNSSMQIWQGRDENIESAREEFLRRLKKNTEALRG